MAVGYDISASDSNSSSAAGGATKLGPVTITTGIGGSVGFSFATIAAVGLGLYLLWKVFFKK